MQFKLNVLKITHFIHYILFVVDNDNGIRASMLTGDKPHTDITTFRFIVS